VGDRLVQPKLTSIVLAQDRIEDAYKSFKTTRAETSDLIIDDEAAIHAEFDLLHRQLIHEKQNAISFLDLFRQPSLRKRCIVGWLTMFGAQGTATLVINSTLMQWSVPVQQLTWQTDYGPLLYGRLGFSPVQQLLIQGGWITVCPFGNWVNALVVDRIGRTRMLSICPNLFLKSTANYLSVWLCWLCRSTYRRVYHGFHLPEYWSSFCGVCGCVFPFPPYRLVSQLL